VAIPLAGVQGLRRPIAATTNSGIRSPSLSLPPPSSPPLAPSSSLSMHPWDSGLDAHAIRERPHLVCAAAVKLPAVIAEREGAAQYEFPYPVKGRAQGRSRGPPIPVIRVGVVAVGIVAIRVRPIFVVAIATATAAAVAVRRCRSSSSPARCIAPGACLVVSNTAVMLKAAQSAANGGPDGDDGSAEIAMQ
jgi:hypothetical protein